MDIEYKTRKLEKICTIAYEADIEYGKEMTEIIHRRIDQIKASDSIKTLVIGKIGRCHQLRGNRVWQYAMDLKHPFRLIFRLKEKEIEVVNILEITDYH